MALENLKRLCTRYNFNGAIATRKFGSRGDRVGGQWEIHGVQSQMVNEEEAVATKRLKDWREPWNRFRGKFVATGVGRKFKEISFARPFGKTRSSVERGGKFLRFPILEIVRDSSEAWRESWFRRARREGTPSRALFRIKSFGFDAFRVSPGRNSILSLTIADESYIFMPRCIFLRSAWILNSRIIDL